MTESPKLLCKMRVSGLRSPTPEIFRQHIDCTLQIEGRDERLSISGTLIGRLGHDMIVEGIDQDDLNIGPVKSAELLMALYCDSGVGEDARHHNALVTDFEVSSSGSGILVRTARDLAEVVWT